MRASNIVHAKRGGVRFYLDHHSELILSKDKKEKKSATHGVNKHAMTILACKDSSWRRDILPDPSDDPLFPAAPGNEGCVEGSLSTSAESLQSDDPTPFKENGLGMDCRTNR